MTIEHRSGDLFAQTDLQALAHGVNCRGVMGAGIAVAFKRAHPKMYREYRETCEIFEGELLGDIDPYAYKADPEKGGLDNIRWVYNLFTQDLPGPHASLNAIDSAVQKMLAHAEGYEVKSIGLPRIGCGIGGLEWDDVEEILNKWAPHYYPQLVVVTL